MSTWRFFVRSGPRLQWPNIARELSSLSLSFRREEVHTLITQAAWQIGPLSDGVREWHIDLEIPSFGSTLLHELECLLERVEANWLEEVTSGLLPLPIFDLRSGNCQRVYELLRKARNIAHKWINVLGSKLDILKTKRRAPTYVDDCAH
ncbi:hypothetical protein EI94DRAFT_1821920 [Lactarius quietus]|nr:hypothetical protein EI94DRAFT_1821920 [Lactarius quietus]